MTYLRELPPPVSAGEGSAPPSPARSFTQAGNKEYLPMAQKKATVERKRVTMDELRKLIKAFKEASSLEGVAKAMDWKIEKVRTQATRLRKRGVVLKKFPKQSSLTETDFADLAKLAGDK